MSNPSTRVSSSAASMVRALGIVVAGIVASGAPSVGAEVAAGKAPRRPLVVNTYYSDPAYEKAFAALVETFEAKHPEIDVAVNTVAGGEYTAAIKTWLPTKNPPDVAGWHPSQKLWSFTAQGLVEPIDDVFEGGFEASFPARMKALCSYQGKLYLVPQSWYWWGVYFNREVLAKHRLTPPATWKDLLDVCARLKAKNVIPIALSTKEPWVLAGWFDHLATAAYGGSFRDALMAGDIAYTDPRVLKTLRYLTDLAEKGNFSPRPEALGPDDAARQLARGEAGMYLVGQSLIAGLPADSQAKLDFFKFPAIDRNESYVEMPIDGYIIPMNAQHKADARTFMTFLAAREQQEAFCQPLGLMAAHKGIPARDGATVKGMKMIEEATGTMQHYDRDTKEAMATKGMAAFIEILAHPERLDTILAALDQDRRRLLGK